MHTPLRINLSELDSVYFQEKCAALCLGGLQVRHFQSNIIHKVIKKPSAVILYI